MNDVNAKRCPNCGAGLGNAHGDYCDVARCLETGFQRRSCGGEDHDCGEDLWSGRWPGEVECEEFGWFDRWRPYSRRVLNPPMVVYDLNRLLRDAVWDREARRWRRRT